MIFNTVHLIWIGETEPPELDKSIEHWRRQAGGRKIEVCRDISALWPAWQAAYDNAMCIESKCDLLRLSLLRRYGGWYFDLDIRVREPLDNIENVCHVARERMFITLYGPHGSFPQNDILACGPLWSGWPMVDAFIAAPVFPLTYMLYGTVMLNWLQAKHPHLFAVAPPDRYGISVVKDIQDLVVFRHGQHTRLGISV